MGMGIRDQERFNDVGRAVYGWVRVHVDIGGAFMSDSVRDRG